MSKNTQKQIVSFESLMVSLLAEYTEELSKDTPSLTASMEIGEKMIEIGKMLDTAEKGVQSIHKLLSNA
jgi:hypothetical protein|tara:strand:+ start:397 stop:603 length:207 start_codon:yes stop_codon:yes gene_type:complete